MSEPTTLFSDSQTPNTKATWITYVAPIIVFSLLTWLETWLPGQYVWVYSAKALLTTLTLIACRASWRDIETSGRAAWWGLFVGLIVFAEWALVESYVPYRHIGDRPGYNPIAAIHNPEVRGLFFMVRFYGLVLMVPVMEELFWRSFLIRYFTDQKWQELPLEAFSLGAFALVAVGFSLAHPEWLAALICAVAYGLLLRYSKSLYACVISHSVTNLCLGIYVVTTGNWKLW